MAQIGLWDFFVGRVPTPSVLLNFVGFVFGITLFPLLIAWMMLIHGRRAGLAGEDDEPQMSVEETMSFLYPDRPIRPLPKRRIRERLSPEVADSIQCPTPQNATSMFYYPYVSRDDDSDTPAPTGRDRPPNLGPIPGRRSGVTSVRGDEGPALMRRNVPRSPPRFLHPTQRLPPSKLDKGKNPDSQPPLSSTSSVDGYHDPFEITNNKKKRKIPSAGDAGPNGAHSVPDDTSGIDSPAATPTEGHGEVPAAALSYYGSSGLLPGAQNVSGSGRGRYGRVRNGRSPLRALSDSTNSWAGRNGKPRPAQWTPQTSENTGVISNAIANAEKLTSPQGQENISLLHQQQQQQQQQQQSSKTNPGITQFTFTCDSQVPTSLPWPGPDRGTSMSTHQNPVPTEDRNAPEGSANASKTAQDRGRPELKGSRRRSAKALALAAKARRRQTEYQNRLNPPKPEDVWICEFCEYETIFGSPPRVLIRGYEIKDRRARKQEAERRRQLEKVKLRSRKGKKGNKGSAKNNNPSQDRNLPQGGSQSTHSHSHNNDSPETHSEFEYDDDFDEEEDYGSIVPPPLERIIDTHGQPPPDEITPQPPGLSSPVGRRASH